MSRIWSERNSTFIRYISFETKYISRCAADFLPLTITFNPSNRGWHHQIFYPDTFPSGMSIIFKSCICIRGRKKGIYNRMINFSRSKVKFSINLPNLRTCDSIYYCETQFAWRMESQWNFKIARKNDPIRNTVVGIQTIAFLSLCISFIRRSYFDLIKWKPYKNWVARVTSSHIARRRIIIHSLLLFFSFFSLSHWKGE